MKIWEEMGRNKKKQGEKGREKNRKKREERGKTERNGINWKKQQEEEEEDN